MANTYTSLYYHIVFSTKFRFPWLTLEIEQRVWAAIAEIAREHKMNPIQIGGGSHPWSRNDASDGCAL